MTILIKHRIPNSKDFLSLEDETKYNQGFCVRYNEHFTYGDSGDIFLSANAQYHEDYNEALKIFNLRRQSANPFCAV